MYKKVRVPNHPYPMKGGYVYLHRRLMEVAIGRYLTPEEEVHHRDGNPSNNALSNLELCPTHKAHMNEHAWQPDELLDLLVRYNDVFGSFPTIAKWDKQPNVPKSGVFIKQFGTWLNARHKAKFRLDEINEDW